MNAGQQVVDVIPLQHAIAQRVEDVTALAVACAGVDEGVPARRQLLHLRFVRGALGVDRLLRVLERNYINNLLEGIERELTQ